MEGEDNVLDAVFEDDDFMDGGDVEMLDVEEGELVDFNSQSGYGSGQSSGGNVSVANQECQDTNQKPKPKKKKKKNKKRNNRHWTASIGTDIDRFVIETCKRLKERKSYLVYTAVGCLGIAALSDLIKEVDAIQACGGQMTSDGRRFRYGGGILWNIIKSREPKAYREIMKKARDFEKQFKKPSRPAIEQRKEGSSANSSKDGTPANVSDDSPVPCEMQTQADQSNPK